MTKSEFLQELEVLLVELPPENREDLIALYDEIFKAQTKLGKTEKEILTSLDEPRVIARIHVTEYLLDTAERHLTTPNLLRVMQAALKTGLSNLILLIAPVLGIIGVVSTLLATGGIVIITGLALFLGVFIRPMTIFSKTIPLFFYENMIIAAGTFFLSIGLVAFGLLFLIGSYILVRLIYMGTLRHLRFHLITQKRR